MAEPTGQSSQLFPLATGRNAQFLATIAKSTLSPAIQLAHLREYPTDFSPVTEVLHDLTKRN